MEKIFWQLCIISHTVNQRLQGEQQFHSKNYQLEMPSSHAKMCLKSAPQKLKFAMAEFISKSYRLDRSYKCLARTIENWEKWILDSERPFKIKVKCSKFRLHQQLFAFKEFYIEKRLSNIFKTVNDDIFTKLTKTILKRSYRAPQESPCLISKIIFEENIYLVIFHELTKF